MGLQIGRARKSGPGATSHTNKQQSRRDLCELVPPASVRFGTDDQPAVWARKWEEECVARDSGPRMAMAMEAVSGRLVTVTRARLVRHWHLAPKLGKHEFLRVHRG